MERLREGGELTLLQQITMILRMSIPAILAQISSIVMQYIDASMVGRLGAEESAAIGLVSSSTWLMGGLCSAAGIGFTVQIAHKIGADKKAEARNIVKIGLITTLIFSTAVMLAGAAISGALPGLLGGGKELRRGASSYFLVYALFMPAFQINSVAGGMLQCSGNMKIPGMLNILMCFLDVAYNFLLIFPAREIEIFGSRLTVFGADLGVTGAALGTALAELTSALLMLYFLLVRSEALHLRKGEGVRFSAAELKKALRISLPVGAEQVIMCSAYIAATKIVSPLGTVSIAANSFSVTAESLCYMPGYGIGSAATAIVGQSIGAGRKDMAKRLGWMSVSLGMLFMAVTGFLMYVNAHYMIGFLTDDPEICRLGARVLRTEAFAEPMYAASIVVSGVLRGAGDTFIPSCLNFCSMWLVRLPLSMFLAPRYGLMGVWLAMCIELCVRGALFLIRMARKKL